MLGNVIFLAVSAAFNPILIGVVLVTLASPRPKALLGAYVAGGMTMSVGLGIGAVAVAQSSGAVTSSTSSTNAGIELALGILLLLVAVWFATGRAEARKAAKAARAASGPPKPAKPSLSDRLLGDSRASLAFVAGVILTLPSAMYLDALKDIAEANVSNAAEVGAILLFNVIMLSPALVPLAFLVVKPEGTRAAVERADGWMHRNQTAIVVSVSGVVGLYMVVKSILELT